jgi:hypothetical protein
MVGKQVVIEVEYEAPYTKEMHTVYIDLRSHVLTRCLVNSLDKPSSRRAGELGHMTTLGLYCDFCLVHKPDKDGAGWYPKKT